MSIFLFSRNNGLEGCQLPDMPTNPVLRLSIAKRYSDGLKLRIAFGARTVETIPQTSTGGSSFYYPDGSTSNAYYEAGKILGTES
jgi:hypothetical protein